MVRLTPEMKEVFARQKVFAINSHGFFIRLCFALLENYPRHGLSQKIETYMD